MIVCESTTETVHREVEGRVVVVDRTEQFAHFDVRVEFFADLAAQGLLRCFVGFDLTAGELPPVFPFSIASLGRKNATLGIYDDGGYHFDGLSHCFVVIFNGLW